MEVSGVSMYVNPNTMQVTSNLKNAAGYGKFQHLLMNNYEVNNNVPTQADLLVEKQFYSALLDKLENV